MRLLLVIERFSIPTASVLWTTNPLRPGQGVNEGNTTIAQLLEQVNEVVPLESEDWGLEDYAVEVRGFECLHFLTLAQILKDDDEVTIRPLQTNDLRYRKLSGRHQIAIDGRHLIDGVPFGRPFLRRTDRPRVRIPPRKRPRLTEGEDELDDVALQSAFPSVLQNEDRRVLRRGSSNAVVRVDEELEEEEQDEEDEDFVMDDQADEDDESTADDGELAQELQDLEQDGGRTISTLLRGSEASHGPSTKPRRTFRKRPLNDANKQGLGIQLRDSPAASKRHSSDSQNLHAGPYENPLLDYDYDQDSSHPKSKKAKHSHPPLTTRKILAPREMSPSSGLESRRGSSSSQTRNVRFEDANATTLATIIAKQGESDSDDEVFAAVADTTSESSESDKENVSPEDKIFTFSPVAKYLVSTGQRGEHAEETSTRRPGSSQSIDHSSLRSSSSEPTDTSSSLSTSSSGSSSPESESESDSDTDSESDSDSDSDSEHQSSASESHTSPLRTRKASQQKMKLKEVNGKPTKASTTAPASQQTLKQAPPGKGQKQTKMRNLRRRVSSRLKNLKKRGEIPGTFTREDYLKWEEERQALQQGRKTLARPRLEQEQPVRSKLEQEHLARSMRANQLADEDLASTLEAKKAELLQSIGAELNGQVASNETLQTMVDDHVTSNETLQAMVEDHGEATPGPPDSRKQGETIVDEVEHSLVNAIQNPNQALSSLHKVENRTPQPEATGIKPNKRRAKLDVASSRRMLFGSLGVRAPKSQEEADAVRQKLTANIRTAPQPKPDASLKPVELETPDLGADTSWEDKVVLKAVECCHDGVELSTPPFPFVQRWDPQQRGKSNRSKPSKKRERRASQYYENGRMGEPEEEYVFEEGKQGAEIPGEEVSHAKSDLYPTLSEQYQSAASEQLLRDVGVLAANTRTDFAAQDLPELPMDIETYSALTPATALPGAIVAFKQLELSARTCWQPQVSKYQIASIESGQTTDESDSLRLRVASRDLGGQAADFDAATGERIYGKFEMPMSDEDDINDYLELFLNDMIEPKLIRPSTIADNQPETHGQEIIESAPMVQVEETSQEDSILGSKIAHVEDHLHSMSVIKDSVSQEKQHEMNHGEKTLSSDGSDSVSRKEVSLLIKGAGFRSSVDPEAARELQIIGQNDETEEKGQKEEEDHDNDSIQSPSFNGFGSSPPRIEDDAEDERQASDQGSSWEDDEEQDSEQESSGEEDGEEQVSEQIDSRSLEGDEEEENPPNAEEDQGDRAGLEERSHDQTFDTTDNSNLEGTSTNKALDNTDLSNLDGTTELNDLDGASYDMIGTQAAPKLGTSSPNPLPSPIQMPTISNNDPSSDPLPETIPPTSTSKVDGDSPPHQQPFRDSSKSPVSKLLDGLDQRSSPIRRSRARKTLVMRGGHDSRRELDSDSPASSDGYKSSQSGKAFDSDSELPSFEKILHSSARSPIALSSDPLRPESSSPPRGRATKNARTRVNARDKNFRKPANGRNVTGLNASQAEIKKESFSQSQTRIKKEQYSQSFNFLDDDDLDASNHIDDDDDKGFDNIGTRAPKRGVVKPEEEKVSVETRETGTPPKEAVIVDLTQESDLQSPGGSDYGGSKAMKGGRSKRSGGRGTQSLGGEGIGRGNARATRKRVVERTRSRV